MVKYFYLIEFLEQIREHIMMLRIVPTSGSFFRCSYNLAYKLYQSLFEAPVKENRYNFDNRNLGYE